ncbi:NAD(P)-dependent oxidoreductase [Roseovarius sp. MMSF_3281]|uniref:NAD-dependent epimerase/dehydratase family protein n=1 Tax=Roseovarius sp. MMSF_3281 TaxID=3046694 RepID=UPI00273E4BE9|nr:NAD(P)-dependent oxidoreductase [Roseovarius sp. MMSF_3281]
MTNRPETPQDAEEPSNTRALGRVLITGGGGFLGAAISKGLLDRGDDIVTSDIGFATSPDGARVQCDVTRFDQVDDVVRQGGFETILHCGAVSGPMVMPDRPLDIWRINGDGTANVLEAARRHQVTRVVICSTSEVYGDQAGHVDETTPPRPDNVYAASKLAGEQLMTAYARQHGLDAVALRLSWIYGPGRQTPTTLEKMLRAAATGQPSRLTVPSDSYTHFLHIDDAVRGVILAARVEHLHERILNITAGRGVVMEDVVNLARDLYPEVTITCAPADPTARGLSGIDNILAMRALEFRPQTPLSKGIPDLCAHLASAPMGQN